jgi:2-polyprenyl-3-methyl-5-hydroxy-6-metoxy-1,4-benzoquinol methylase
VRGQLPRGGAVLDVGCASGGLLAALDAEAGHREGIELDPVAAAAARAHADAVHVGPVDEVDVAEAAFDVVVLGDVLEHLPDPHVALERAQRWLRPDGRLVISLPNVAHWTVRLGLLLGRWEYRDRGILDDTHLRFFTRSSIEDLFAGSGFVIDEVRGINRYSPRSLPRSVLTRFMGDLRYPQFAVRAHLDHRLARSAPTRP